MEKKSKNLKNQQGQLLLEILVVVGITAIIGVIAAQTIYVGAIGNKAASGRNTALGLAQEAFEAAQNAAIEKWQNIYSLTKGSTNYYPLQSGGKWTIAVGSEQVTLGNIIFTRYINIKNVCREAIDTGNNGRDITGITDSNGSATTCATSGGTHDPSTQKISVSIGWTGGAPVLMSDYISRWPNKICNQTSWQTSGSSGVKTCPDTTYDTISNITPGSDLVLCSGGC